MLWERLAAQCAAAAAPWDRALGAERELFRMRPDGRRTARCVLVDTEPKAGDHRAGRPMLVAMCCCMDTWTGDASRKR